MNLRLVPRLRRRLRVTIGAVQAFTSDISSTGFSVELMQALRPGTLQHGSIELCGAAFDYTGQVCWAKSGEPRMNMRGRMGLRFTGIPNAFFELLKTAYQPLVPAH